jgi:hypothetical protein
MSSSKAVLLFRCSFRWILYLEAVAPRVDTSSIFVSWYNVDRVANSLTLLKIEPFATSHSCVLDVSLALIYVVDYSHSSQICSMHALRSRSRHHESSDSSEHFSRAHREGNRTLKQRSSLDGFVIHGRTRYPSAKIPVPGPIDFHIAKSLLDSDLENRSYNSIDAWQTTRDSELGGIHDQAVHIRHQSGQRIWSNHSTHGYGDGLYFTKLGSASGNSSRVTSDFVGWYNDLANQHGLRKIPGRNSSGTHRPIVVMCSSNYLSKEPRLV